MPKAQQTMLTPTDIRRDSRTQIRIDLSPETISRYELMIEQADYEWPFTDPLVAFSDGETHWLADGFQRDLAWQNVFTSLGQKIPPYPVELRTGTLRDAIRYATHEANRHGQPYTRKDRRKLATLLIEDQEWTHYSNRQIARIAGLDEKTIRNIRKELAAEARMERPMEGIASPANGVKREKGFNATVAGVTPAETPHLQQMPLYDVRGGTQPRPVLPAIYAPVEEHQIIQLQTPLACTIIDAEQLVLCCKPATVAFAWVVQDERKGAVWQLRPVCVECRAMTK